jgi:hypothetical protein
MNFQHDTQARIARGIHGLPRVSPRPSMPDPSMPCGRATPKTASHGLRLSSTLLDTPRRTGLMT